MEIRALEWEDNSWEVEVFKDYLTGDETLVMEMHLHYTSKGAFGTYYIEGWEKGWGDGFMGFYVSIPHINKNIQTDTLAEAKTLCEAHHQERVRKILGELMGWVIPTGEEAS